MSSQHRPPDAEGPFHLRSPTDSRPDGVTMLLVVEGQYDMEFLRRISEVLGQADNTVPRLAELESSGQIVSLPVGGGDLAAWTHRLAPLGKCEFHLYDRELSPESEHRQKLVALINQRSGCQALLTSKRSLENYLHPAAVYAAGGLELEFDDEAPVAELVARRRFLLMSMEGMPWEHLPHRARRRLTYRAKRWLNTRAVAHMTPDLLAERDSGGEVRSWLAMMGAMLAST